jgi:subtilisin family serine protease
LHFITKTSAMRYILFHVLLFSVFLLQAQGIDLSQDSLYHDNTLIMKLKDQYRPLAQNDGINSMDVAVALNNVNITSFVKLFPRHNKPAEAVNRYGDSLVDISLIYQLKYSGNIPENQVVNRLRKTNMFEYVERRPRSFLMFVPNDTFLTKQYFPRVVHAFEAWDVEQGDSTVVIGIVDTGTDINGEDLKDGIAYNYNDTIDGVDNDNDGYVDNFMGWDLGMNDNNPMSYWNHHGCFTTGVSSARVDNQVGIAGLGYKTKYLPVRVCDDLGHLNSEWEGLVYAADHGAQIINNSWGGFVKTRFGQDIVNYATYNRNALVIAAAGNSNIDYYLWPASFENVLSVAATDSLDQRWSGSSFGTSVDLTAPGDHVYSTWTYNGYFASSGTSFSAPGVAGAAAIVLSHYPNLSALQLGEQMRVTADNIDTVAANIPYAGLLGAGRLNMYKALTDTSKPAIRFRNRIVVSTGNKPGDTIKLSGEFVNFLHPSGTSLKATVTPVSSHLSIVNPIIQLGQLATFGTVNNYQQPFIIKISPNTPPGTEADIKITYTDTSTGYSGFEYFRFDINNDFANLDTNDIITTISSNSVIGYGNYQKSHGEGVKYKNSRTLLSWAGFVAGNSTAKVSSNIYGANGYDADFAPVANIREISPATAGDQEFVSVYNDNPAGIHKLNLKVVQHSFAYHSKPDNVVFLQYKIYNTWVVPLTTFYAGIYADFDIDVSYRNKAYYDSTNRLAYTVPEGGGPCAGIMLLDSFPVNVYNIDNDGSNGSVNIYDGFIDYEKFTALQGGRDSAGYVNSYGNDVSSMISAGPLNLQPGDSVTITFALLAADHEYGIKKAAKEAFGVYYNLAGISLNTDLQDKIKVVPNPVGDKTSFYFDSPVSGNPVIIIYGQDGRKVMSKKLNSHGNKQAFELDTSSLPAGTYFYIVDTANKSYSGKIIKL